jgi:adenylate cyclase
MQHAFRAANVLTSEDLDIHISCGIDYGKILLIGQEDCFGDPVNRASKIGEDLATAGEILITKEAMQMIPQEAGITAREMNVSISGVTIPAYLIDYRNEAKILQPPQ